MTYAGPITFVTWLWRGWRPVYTAEHVNRLHRMLKQHMSGIWRLVCITDMPEGIECETFPMPVVREAVGIKAKAPNCFRRLWMFSEEAACFFDRTVSIDIDCNIYADLRPLLTRDDFKCARGQHSYLNGSLYQLQHGTNTDIWTDFDPVESPKLIARTPHGTRIISGSDQAWLSIKRPKAPRWTETDGVHQRMHLPMYRVPSNCRVLFFAGGVKPWEKRCKEQFPEFYLPEGA